MEATVNKDRVYFLRRKSANKWSGVTAYQGTTIAFSPLISKSTGRLNTGLSKEDEERLEKALQLEKGSLNNAVKPDGVPVSSYWPTYKLEVPEKGLDLDPTNPAHELAIIMLKVSSLTTGRGKPSSKAIFELYNTQEEAKASNDNRAQKVEAYSYYASMSASEKVDFCISKGMNVENAKPEIIDDLVGRELETSFAKFNEWVKDDLYKKRVLLNRFVQAGIVRKRGTVYQYKDIQLGINDQTAIEFLERITNQKVKESILQEFNIVNKKKSLDIDLTSESEETVELTEEEIGAGKKEESDSDDVSKDKTGPGVNKNKSLKTV